MFYVFLLNCLLQIATEILVAIFFALGDFTPGWKSAVGRRTE